MDWLQYLGWEQERRATGVNSTGDTTTDSHVDPFTAMASFLQTPLPAAETPPKPNSSEEQAPTRASSTDESGVESAITDSEIAAFKDLFDKVDVNKNGEISKEELAAALQGESEMVLSRSHKLRVLMSELANGSKTGVRPKEFAELMKELFWLSYVPFFKSAHMEMQLTAAAWKHATGKNAQDSALREECNYMHCFQGLKEHSREKRVEVFRAVLSSTIDSMAQKLADGVVAAGHYAMQQEQGQHSGKFAGMVLGDPLCFDVGLETMGLPDLDFEGAISREHASEDPFTAWNNDIERETSAAKQLQMVLPDGWGGKVNNKDYAGNVMCVDFEEHPLALAAGLCKCELVMLRLYTGPMYVKYNGRLRMLLRLMKEHLGAKTATTRAVKEAMEAACKELGPAFLTSIVVLVSALQKVRVVNPLPPGRKVYRGLAGLQVPESFKREDAQGNRGGVEFGLLSTSTSKEQAIGYIDFSKGMPQLYEMEVGQIDRGSDVSWISYFPAEAEVLMPPLCSLEAVGDPKIEDVKVHRHGGASEGEEEIHQVMVWPIRINVNLKGRTIDEHRANRKNLHAQMATNALAEAAQVVTRMLAEAEEEEGRGELAGLGQEVLRQCEEVVVRYRETEEGFFNDDNGYSAAIQDVLLLKPWAEGVLQLHVLFKLPVAELAALQLSEQLPSARSVEVSATGRGKAALEVCRRRGLFEGELDDKDSTEGKTPLFMYAEDGKREEVELLLLAGARTEVPDMCQETALFAACTKGQAEVVRTLHRFGADIEACNDSGVHALEWVITLGSSFDDHLDRTAEVLIELGAQHSQPLRMKSFLYEAVQNCMPRTVAALLAKGGADVEHEERVGTCLVYAILSRPDKGEVMARALVEHGADVNRATKSGDRPLHSACTQPGMEDLALFLLDRGADPLAVDRDGTALIPACESVYPRLVRRLVEAKAGLGAVERRDFTDTPLTAVLRPATEDVEAREEIAALLIERGVNVNAASAVPDGWTDWSPGTPLQLARLYGYKRTEQLLLERGAEEGEGQAIEQTAQTAAE